MQESILLTDVDLTRVAAAREETGFLREVRNETMIHQQASTSP